MSTWPLEIGDLSYSPIPENWISWGYDDGRESEMRLYAVSAAVRQGHWIRIRYTHPTQPHVLTAETLAKQRPGRDDYVPAELASKKKWMRSTTPQGAEPSDVRRSAETAHLRDLWGDRVDEIPSSDEADERAVADGGRVRRRAIAALGDVRQGHLGRSDGGERHV